MQAGRQAGRQLAPGCEAGWWRECQHAFTHPSKPCTHLLGCTLTHRLTHVPTYLSFIVIVILIVITALRSATTDDVAQLLATLQVEVRQASICRYRYSIRYCRYRNGVSRTDAHSRSHTHPPATHPPTPFIHTGPAPAPGAGAGEDEVNRCPEATEE